MGNASKPYPHVRTPRDYNIPNNDGIVLPNPRKGVLHIAHSYDVYIDHLPCSDVNEQRQGLHAACNYLDN